MMELLSLSCSSHPSCHSATIPKWKSVADKPSPLDFRRELGFQKKPTSRNAPAIRCSYGGVTDRDVCPTTTSDNSTSSTPVLPKLLIPGLPSGEPQGNPPPISSCFWEWKPKINVHYEKAGMENMESPPLLFLPGFGVGSFHYEKQMKDLGRDYRVWALDFLGQGKSLPSEDPTLPPPKAAAAAKTGLERSNDPLWGFGEQTEPWADDLVYSVDLWRDQVQNFVENVVGEPVYIVGNSLGGFVALYFAAFNPDLVKGVSLLNATPFWGLLPNPTRSSTLAKLFPWAGTFPLPAQVRTLTQIIWQKMSDPECIHDILKQVYADHSTKVDKVFTHIIEATQHPAAPASFASIMCAPRAKMSFDECLIQCKLQDIPICLMYGKDDPWVKTFWGLQVKKQVPEAPYYEISPAGHCPHDEVPEVINYLLRGWIKNVESEGKFRLPLIEDSKYLANDISRDVEFVREGSRRLVRIQIYGSDLTIWDRIGLFIKSHVTKLIPMSSN